MNKEELRNSIHEMDDLIASLASHICNRTYDVSVLLAQYERRIEELETKTRPGRSKDYIHFGKNGAKLFADRLYSELLKK